MRRGEIFRRHDDGFASASRRHPDARLGLVLLQLGCRDRVRNPLTIRSDLGIAHILDFKDIVYRDRP